MKTKTAAVLALSLTLSAPITLAAGEAQAVGCLSGAVVGGVAGHVAGHHTLLGAAAGCAVGHHMAVEKKKKIAAQKAAARAQAANTQPAHH